MRDRKDVDLDERAGGKKEPGGVEEGETIVTICCREESIFNKRNIMKKNAHTLYWDIMKGVEM